MDALLRRRMMMLAGSTPVPVSITAEVSSDAVIVDTMAVNDIKPYLVVTAYYGNSAHVTVTDYSLSGTIELGTNTITVSYMGVTTTVSVEAVHNYAGALSTYTLHPASSIVEYVNGTIRMKCTKKEDQTGWGTWAIDNKKTKWSDVNGKTIRIRIKVNDYGSTIGIGGPGIYQSNSINSLANSYCKRASMPSLTLANDGYLECTLVCNISNFTIGSLSPGTNAMFGLFFYARSLTDFFIIYDVEIIEVVS